MKRIRRVVAFVVGSLALNASAFACGGLGPCPGVTPSDDPTLGKAGAHRHAYVRVISDGKPLTVPGSIGRLALLPKDLPVAQLNGRQLISADLVQDLLTQGQWCYLNVHKHGSLTDRVHFGHSGVAARLVDLFTNWGRMEFLEGAKARIGMVTTGEGHHHRPLDWSTVRWIGTHENPSEITLDEGVVVELTILVKVD